MTTLQYKPKQVSKKILSELGDRALDVILNRFGLTPDSERKTLELIGQKYGITRERVRQIENSALTGIRKSETYTESKIDFQELSELINSLGGVIGEEELLSIVAKDKATQNHIHFHLVLADEFFDHKEDEHFKKRWTTNQELSDKVHESLKKLYASLKDDELLSEPELVSRFLDSLKDVANNYRDEEILKRWLRLSKKVDVNPLGEWGKIDSKNIRTRGVKDYAYLIMRRHGSPMHFKEVAEAISKTFGKKCHSATCHNELIKDERFVLVGRGMYGLAEWGYKPGIVKDVIKGIIQKEGALTKDQVVDRVLKERYLKRNTILVNLQNPKFFKKSKDGKYSIVK